jgi:hypothetical protein
MRFRWENFIALRETPELTCRVLAGSRAFRNSVNIRLAASGQEKFGITRFARPAVLVPVLPVPPL